MKKVILLLIFLAVVFGFDLQNRKQLLSTAFIGKYSYSIYKETKYIHDENRDMDFFVVYGKDNKNQCSAFMSDKKKDTALVYGKYSFTKKYLEFREYYFNSSYHDSVIKRFYPNKIGNLILLRYITYKNGAEKITKY